MKRILYTGLLLALTACTNNGYTIKGEIVDARDGDSIFIISLENLQPVKMAGSVINDGKFQLKGVQNEPVVRYLVYHFGEDDGQTMEFFLENGNIHVTMAEEHSSVSGTLCNDAYQGVMTEMQELQDKMDPIYEALAGDELSDEQRAAFTKQVEEMDDAYTEILIRGTRNNINNAAGIFMLKNYYYYMNTPQLAEIVEMVPEKYAADKQIQLIKEQVSKLMATGVGQPFTDLELKTPEGKNVKLSDYAGKGKVVLVDFWASWCGPCRQEMPNVVKVYKDFKDKGFEIVGVSLDQTLEAWKKGITDLGITWPQMSDLKYWQSEAVAVYRVEAIPHTVLIDKDGTILARNLRGEALYKKIEELIER